MVGFAESKKKYNPQEEGYGNSRQWKRAFFHRMSTEEAQETLNDDDPYSILGIREGATKSDIKKAYYKMAMKWHPDKNPDKIDLATEMMKKINAAYSILI